jgi:glucarate dehydratase
MKIQSVKITPVAVPDYPVRNLKGVHQGVFLRSIIEVTTDSGSVGVSESYGAKRTLAGLRGAAEALVGLDIFDLNGLRSRIVEALPDAGGINAPSALADHKVVDVVYSAYEVALLDLQGKHLDRPVSDLLGGAVRREVSYGGYLFYKYAKPSDQPGEDLFGEVMTPDALVDQARQLVAENGFRSLKLKGGVLEPDLEAETMVKLREAFPEAPLRIDPMGAWCVETSIRMARRLADVLEYLEDPAPKMDGMAAVAAFSPLPLATNLVVVEFPQIFEAARKNAVQIILSDHHYWRGMTGCVTLGRICAAAGMGVSMHSNTHLGISLAAMTHVAAATPNLTYDCDTHYSWTPKDVIKGGKMKFRDGKLAVPTGPGLGVDLDREALAEAHALYQSAGVADRDDLAEIRKYEPGFERQVPKW